MSSRLRFSLIILSTLFVSNASVYAQRGTNFDASSLVPGDLFPASAGKTIGYPIGFDVAYFPLQGSHQWKLDERAVDATPTSTPADGAAGGEAVPDPAAGEGSATGAKLGPTKDEAQYTTEVGLLRPTFVTIVFTESADEAKRMLKEFVTEKQDLQKLTTVEIAEEPEEAPADNDTDTAAEVEKPYVPPIVVFKLEEDTKLGAYVYNRELNLGRAGGMRRASAVVAAKGAVFLRVDARKGLLDTVYDGEEKNLEQRARSVAQFLLKKM